MKGTHFLLRVMRVNTSTCCQTGAPPDKFGVLYHLLHREFYDFNNRIDVSELSHFGSWY